MNRRRLLALLPGLLIFAPLPALTQAGSEWVAVESTLTYHMTHPLHDVDGTSHAAKGKGVCSGGQCQFLIAAPVNTFTSGDTNRDLHMLEATRGAAFPMVVVQARFPESQLQSSTIEADLEVQFAGQTHSYAHVAFQRTAQGSEMRITGTIPLTCLDFKMDRPSFLGVAIKNEIPVSVEMTWRQM